MMIDFIEKIRVFNSIVDAKQEFMPRKAALYIGLQLEEMAEKLESLTMDPNIRNLFVSLNSMSEKFKQGDYDDIVAGIDKVAALDADIDLAVVAIGGAIALGADAQGAAHEVADSNLSKFVRDENNQLVAIRDSNGKVVKGPNYRPPELYKYINK